MAGRGKSSTNEVVSPEVRALQQIARVLALSAMKGLSNQKDQARFLKGVGYGVQEIADVLGIRARQVSLALYSAKKSKRQKKTK